MGDRLKELREPVVALANSRLHPRLEHSVAVLDALNATLSVILVFPPISSKNTVSRVTCPFMLSNWRCIDKLRGHTSW